MSTLKTITLTPEEIETVCSRFQIPDAGRSFLKLFFNEKELDLLLHCEKDQFSESDYAKEFLESAYRRGVISKVDQAGTAYKISDFYSMLDVFCVSRKDEYDTLSREQKGALDDWYFREYYEGLDPDPEARPTEDVVLTLEEMYAYIDKQERQAYLNYCDCRSLTGDCGFPTRTCITYRNGINGFVDRGLSKAITKEEAKEVVRNADQAGLMHTANPNGLCNCCGDCCYLFRSQRLRNSRGFWPESPHIVEMDEEKCISCGKCIKRCHFGIFFRSDAEDPEKESGAAEPFDTRDPSASRTRRKRKKILHDTTNCVGCGLCVNTCPAGALQLIARG